MKWFKTWFRNQCVEAWNSHQEEETLGYEAVSRKPARLSRGMQSTTSDIRTPGGNGTTFILYPAAGGNILEVRMYDEKTGENHISLHIIPNDQDLGESIGKIITFEVLKR